MKIKWKESILLWLCVSCSITTSFAYDNLLSDYWRTKASGDWTNSAIWESSPDGITWYDISNSLVPDSTSTVTIQNDITLNSTLTAGIVTVNSGSTFTLLSSGILRFGLSKLFTVNGTFENQNPANNSLKNSTTTYVKFNAGSFYKLTAVLLYGTNCGLVPTATWDITSTVLITGTKTSGGIWGISGATLGNLTYDCPNQTSTYICLLGGFSITTVNGTLNIIRTGTGKIGLTQSKFIVNNYNQTGGIVSINGVASGAGLNRILQVNGNFNLSGTSTFYFTNSTSTSANYKGYLMLYGNLNIESGATLTPYVGTLYGNHYPVICFCGNTMQSTSNNGSISGVINDSIVNPNGILCNTDFKATGRLSLMSGTINLSTNRLTYSGNTIYRTNGTINVSTTGSTLEMTNSSALTIPANTFTGNVDNLTINSSGVVSLGSNTTINSGLNLTSGTLSTGSNTLTLKGNITGSGTINTGSSGTLVFAGSTTQALDATNLTSGNVNVLNVAAGSKLNTSGTISATTLNIQSDATGGTGTLIDGGTLTATNTSVQQYLANARNWYISSPVSNATFPSGYTYYERNEGSSSWPSPSTLEFMPGKGYIALPSSTGSTLTFSTQSGGQLNSGDVDVALTASATGYNLIGNPYPAHLNWTKTFVDNNVSLIEPTIWYRTNTGTTNNSGQWSFLTLNASSGESTPEGVSSIIPPMQAFWIKAKTAGTLTLNEYLTILHESNNPLKAPSETVTTRQKLRLKVLGENIEDETLLFFDPNASNNIDNFDSEKFIQNNAQIQLYTKSEGKDLAINAMNSIPYNIEIPIKLKSTIVGDYNVNLQILQKLNIDENTSVFLRDYSNIQNYSDTELTELNGLSLKLNNETDIANRFSLIFKVKENSTFVHTGLMNNINISLHRFTITIYNDNPISGNESYDLVDVLGNRLQSGKLNGIRTELPIHNLPSIVFIRLNLNGEIVTRKLII